MFTPSYRVIDLLIDDGYTLLVERKSKVINFTYPFIHDIVEVNSYFSEYGIIWRDSVTGERANLALETLLEGLYKQQFYLRFRAKNNG